MTKVAILQSNYLPWKGYFDIIHQVDLFIFHDDLQYTKNDWRNRNKIKTPNGTVWLTIPCGSSEKRLINEVEIKDHRWQAKHWAQLQQHYGKTPFFKHYKPFFEDFYCARQWTGLSELNQYLIKHITREILGNRHTKFANSSQYQLTERKAQRVLELLGKAKATSYLSGPAARDYLDEQSFKDHDIDLQWMDYGDYPEYAQQYPPFEHGVSIIDLLFNEGPDAGQFMKTQQQ